VVQRGKQIGRTTANSIKHPSCGCAARNSNAQELAAKHKTLSSFWHCVVVVVLAHHSVGAAAAQCHFSNHRIRQPTELAQLAMRLVRHRRTATETAGTGYISTLSHTALPSSQEPSLFAHTVSMASIRTLALFCASRVGWLFALPRFS
jgi:hypothetical protein